MGLGFWVFGVLGTVGVVKGRPEVGCEQGMESCAVWPHCPWSSVLPRPGQTRRTGQEGPAGQAGRVHSG